MAPYTPTLLQHINLAVPAGTLDLATQFYGGVIGFGSDTVPQLQRDSLLWYVWLSKHPLMIGFALETGLNRWELTMR